MKKHKSTIILGVILVSLSILLHGLHYVIFDDMHHIMIFLLADIAFIPLEVFFVSLVLERVIEQRDHKQAMRKLNMLVGMFYQKIGNELLTLLVQSDTISKDESFAEISFKWEKEHYQRLVEMMEKHPHHVNVDAIDLLALRTLLNEHEGLVVSMISNPALIEHESFSDLLMSLFHLSAELNERELQDLSQEDLDHLKVDIERVYKHLSLEWAGHMHILQKEYPYLFLTSIKNNPYDKRDGEIIEREALAGY